MQKGKKASWMEIFQGLGKTFMLPVALLAFMGLFLGIGSFMSTIGGFAFSYLPVMFAMAIPLGLARKEKGVAAFSGFVGYVVMHLSINFYLQETNQLAAADQLREAGQEIVFGIQTLSMGVLGGIIAGLIVYKLHMRFYHFQLPDSFAFFSGARFVPIITSLTLAIWFR